MSSLLQFEDFAPDAEPVRDAVVRGAFSTEAGPDGGKYTGISTHAVPHWPDRIAHFLGRKIVPRVSCFRLNLDGELPHSWVHSDGICAGWASVLYLNRPEQCSGGTAFWHHTKLDIDRLPSPEELVNRGVNVESFYQQMDRDWKELGLWKMTRHIAMKWNRFITYPTSLFHSRYPFEGFGKGPEDGRLIWICFYDFADGGLS